jgi:hypothetical protein
MNSVVWTTRLEVTEIKKEGATLNSKKRKKCDKPNVGPPLYQGLNTFDKMIWAVVFSKIQKVSSSAKCNLHTTLFLID